MTKNAATLKNLKVRVNKDGTLSKKSLEDVQGLVKPNPLEKLIPQVKGRDIVLVGTFAGLTVAYKKGLIDLLSPFLQDVRGTAALVLGVAPALAVQGIMELTADIERLKKRKWYLEQITKAEADIKRVGDLLSGATPKRDGTPVTDTERATGEAFIAERREFIAFAEANMEDDKKIDVEIKAEVELAQWAVAMGLAGASIYLLQSHTISDIVELVPGQ